MLGIRPYAFGLLLVGSTALAQSPTYTVLLSEGDPIGTVGAANAGFSDFADHLAINNSGDWIIFADTDNSDSTMDGVVLRNGVLVYADSDPAPGAAPGELLDIASFNYDHSLRDDGSAAFAWALRNTPASPDDSSVITWMDIQAGREGNPVTPSGMWGAGTVFRALDEVDVLNDGRLVVRGRVDDPTNAITNDWFCAVWTLDGAGQVASEVVLARSGEILPGQAAGADVNTVRAGDHNGAFDNTGRVMFGCDLNSASQDGVVYLYDPAMSPMPMLLAQEGSTFVPEGQPWSSLTSPEMSLNDTGDWLLKGQLTGPTTDIIVVNDATFRKDGDPLSISSGTVNLDTFGVGPAHLTDEGGVLFYAEWPGSSTADEGLFYWNGTSDEVLLEEGQLLNGMTVGRIATTSNPYYISSNARFVIVNVQLDGEWTVVLIDRGASFESFCQGDGGDGMGCTDCPCGNNAAAGATGGCLNSVGSSALLEASGDASLANDTLRFEVQAAAPSTFALLVSAENQLPNMGPCPSGSGIQSPVLDGLRCIGGNAIRHGSRSTDVNGDVGVTTNGWGPPNGPMGGLLAQTAAAAGQTRNFQCFYREDPLLSCQTGQNTTQAIAVQIVP